MFDTQSFLALCTVLASMRPCVAQQPFPTHADSGSWSVLSCIMGIGTYCTSATVAFESSTSFCGHTWSVHNWPTFGDPGVAYVRNEGQRTLLRRTTDCEDKEYLLYDFSMDVGDSVYAPLNMDLLPVDTTIFVLQDIDTVVYSGGLPRRRFSLLYDRCNDGQVWSPDQWIEGIGSLMHPFYPVECVCDFCEQTLTLLCYDSAGVQLYQDATYGTCDTLITGVDELAGVAADILNVRYDPISQELYVTARPVAERTGDETLILLAIDGRVVGRYDLPIPFTGERRIDVSRVAQGIHLLFIESSGRRMTSRPLMIR